MWCFVWRLKQNNNIYVNKMVKCMRNGPIKLVYPRHFLLKYMYQFRNVSSHVFVSLGLSIVPLSTIFLLYFGSIPT
jgi:hypothetical protein